MIALAVMTRRVHGSAATALRRAARGASFRPLIRLCGLLAMAALPGGGFAAAPLFETTQIYPAAPNNKPNYRIPGILQAPNGDILIFAEKRNDGIGDIGNHDIVLKRSSDLGKTWSAEQVIFDDEQRVCTDLTVGIDRPNGKLWLFFLRDKKQYAHFTSTDNGGTWQGPVSIHAQVTKPEWDQLKGREENEGATPKGRAAIWEKGWFQRYGIGPGNAMIQLQSGPKAGRLIVPARHRADTGQGRLRSFAHSFYSDDHGQTWKLGGDIGLNTSECQLVELADGSVMVVSRNESSEDSPDNLRHLVAVSHDGGETWGGLHRAEELITPRCHGPVERFTLAGKDDRNRILFSSPASPHREVEHPYGRYNLTVRLSYDEGQTWTAGKTIWPHTGSYSDMVVLNDKSIAYIYERGPKGSTHYWDELHFARFNLEWLTDGRDALPTGPARPALGQQTLPQLIKEVQRLGAQAEKESGSDLVRPSQEILYHLLAGVAAGGKVIAGLSAADERVFDMALHGGAVKQLVEIAPDARVALIDRAMQDKSGSYWIKSATLYAPRDGRWIKVGVGVAFK